VLPGAGPVISWLVEDPDGGAGIYVIDNSDQGYNFNITAQKYDTPNFITSSHLLFEYFSNKSKYFFTDFYIRRRKELGILIDDTNRPVGGKWTYDNDNRKKLPNNLMVPKIKFPDENNFVKQAKDYINKYFHNNIGSMDNFEFPVTHNDAENLFNDFLSKRFINFGQYEDAISSQENFLFHSLLSSSINIGLLNPDDILKQVLRISAGNKIPLNSLEGFIRQIIGWREFIRGVYIFKGTVQRNSNFFNHNNELPGSFYNADTGILPVDNVIKKVLKGAYSHHIERLMILGKFMMLCEINPNDIYKWFMELYIDSYDWVMVPNVYGMSQYADGGLITTKPYISSSNYIRKMSNYKKGEWSDIWDSLYWRFIHKHRNFFEKNPRLSMMTMHLDKMNEKEIHEIIGKAEIFLNKLFR